MLKNAKLKTANKPVLIRATHTRKRYSKQSMSTRVLSEGHRERLAAGRAHAQACGKSSRQIGQEKTAVVLHHIYRHGFSTPALVEQLADKNRNGLVTRLEKSGFIQRTRTQSGGGHRDIPTWILTLTAIGVNEVERQFDSSFQLLPYELDPAKFHQQNLRHDCIIQRLTLTHLQAGLITGYLTGRELASRSQANQKQPDIVWLSATGKTAVEVELTSKWHRDLDQFVRSTLISLAGTAELPARFDQVLIFSDSQAIRANYRAAFTPSASYGVWVKDAQRKWVRKEQKMVPAWSTQKIQFKELE